MVRSIDLNDIRLLMQVIEYGSYTAASRVNGMPKSTISQRIAALEKAVGTGLLRRTSRSFSLTDTGALLLPYARSIEELARKVELVLLEQGEELAGTLRVSSSTAIAQYALSLVVPRFLERHPGATIRVEATNRLVDLVSEGFDMTLRGHVAPLRDSILIQRVVSRTPWTIAASPSLIRDNGMPTSPESLSGIPVLHFATSCDAPTWTLNSPDQVVRVATTPRLSSDDMTTLIASAVAGGGIVGLPTYVLAPALKNGQLVPVLQRWTLPTSSISILTPPKPQSSRLAGAFSDFLAKEIPRVTQEVAV